MSMMYKYNDLLIRAEGNALTIKRNNLEVMFYTDVPLVNEDMVWTTLLQIYDAAKECNNYANYDRFYQRYIGSRTLEEIQTRWAFITVAYEKISSLYSCIDVAIEAYMTMVMDTGRSGFIEVR